MVVVVLATLDSEDTCTGFPSAPTIMPKTDLTCEHKLSERVYLPTFFEFSVSYFLLPIVTRTFVETLQTNTMLT